MSRAQRTSRRRLITLAVAWTAAAGALAQTPAQRPAPATAAAKNSSPVPAQRALEPAQWLERMDQALTSRNYDGTFAHWHAGRVEMLRIVHRVQDGAVSERLASLDGSGREFIRTGSSLSCYLPDRRTVLVEQHPPQQSLVGFPTVNDQTASNYEIREVGRARLNRRDTHVITVAPKDEFRYGYRLWIDDSTAMPLKTQLCDAHGQIIEQIVFASLKLPAHIADSAFRPEVSTDGFRWLRSDPALPPGAALAWNAMRLPPGFRMTVRSSQVLPGSANVVDQIVFTDGFASVSVFVERQTASGDQPPVPQSATVGSSSAFSTVVDGHKITAVGEVPPATVQFIATQVKAQEPAALDPRAH
ncbi:MAG TPA: MucB/RseB C-terminal domain-containing protein [Steroidobacteraceae bacterium]|jgi:sigma-E factor negative regulatory protein RseB|nr:MucB/RseB C-terminal domain-containing protein [Steroidobacteraceae bacterium]